VLMKVPDVQTDHVQAWQLELRDEATVGAWLVKGKFSDGSGWWLVSTIHLRDLPGLPPPLKKFKEATHEVTIDEVRPRDGYTEIDPERFLETATWIEPACMAYQAGLLNDEQGAWLSTRIVQFMSAGYQPHAEYEIMWLGTLARHNSLMSNVN
jgi:hypothetical protein